MNGRQFAEAGVAVLGIVAGLVLGFALSIDAGVPLLVILAGVVFAAAFGLLIGTAFGLVARR